MKKLYPSSFIHWHAGSVQGSNPVLYVRDLVGVKRESVSAHFCCFCLLRTNRICQLSLTLTSHWAFWTLAAACATWSSSSTSKAVEPLKLSIELSCRGRHFLSRLSVEMFVYMRIVKKRKEKSIFIFFEDILCLN